MFILTSLEYLWFVTTLIQRYFALIFLADEDEEDYCTVSCQADVEQMMQWVRPKAEILFAEIRNRKVLTT